MKVLKIIFLTIFALVILLIILAVGVYVSCDSSNPKRVEVVVPSELVGKTYTSKRALVYINNLPRYDELSKLVQLNSPSIFASEVDREIDYLTEGGGDLGLLKGHKSASSVRIENIPIGTEFTVVDEYNYKNSYGYCVGAGSNIHYLIVQDEYGNLSEVSELGFRQKFQIDIDVTFEVNKDTNFIIDNINSLYLDNRLVLDFCIAEFIHETINPFKFIKDLKFENEMLVKEISVNDNNKQCRRGYKIEFNSLSSYLTSVYYFRIGNSMENGVALEKFNKAFVIALNFLR